MSKRKTVGEKTNKALKRAIERAWDAPAAVPSATIANIYAEMLGFVRREKAKAFDEGWSSGFSDACTNGQSATNPYRGRAKR